MIRRAEDRDIPVLAALAAKLWPSHTAKEMEADIAETMSKADAVFFLAFDGAAAVGFAQCQLRHDYVEGTSSSPVGYLEGIFVECAHRGRGIAKSLLAACELWAKGKGCTEFASDCTLENEQSQHFHRNLGFAEASRIVCFTKKL